MSDIIVRTVEIPASKKIVVPAAGRIFRVLETTGSFTVAMDGGTPVPMAKARGLGSKSAAQFQSLEFVDTSGSTNTVQFYAGDEEIVVEETQTVELSSASAASITPGQQTLTPEAADITGNTAFANKKSITVICLTGTCTAAGITLQSGDSVTWSVFRHQDKLATVTVIPGGGGTTRVITLA